MSGLHSLKTMSWFFLVGVVCLWCLLISLGFWQLQRADEKKVLLEESNRMMSRSPIAFDTSHQDYSDLRYQRVYANGRFDSEKQFLLDNQVYKGRVGYHVLTPFIMTDSGRVLLVDRGWIPAGTDRRYLPDVSINEDQLKIVGYLYVPYGKPYLLGEVMDQHATWPRLIQAVDWDVINQSLGRTVAPVMLRMEKQWEDGLVHEWVLVPFGPEKHLGYAFQWFAMAAVLFIMSATVYYSRRKSK